MPLARVTGSAAPLRRGGGQNLLRLLTQQHLSARRDSVKKILAWAQAAPAAHPRQDVLQPFLASLDDDRRAKNQQIAALERSSA